TAAGQLLHGGKCYIPYLACPDKQHWFEPGAPFSIVPEAELEAARSEWEELVKVAGAYRRRRRSVGALVLREDGWAELKPVDESGRVVTKQFVFEGDALRVNADCAGGYVRVELLDPSFQPYPGFSAAACVPLAEGDADGAWQTAHWKGEADLRSLWNKPCRLRFHLHRASLYAFQFVETRQP
ncbi:MAG TPA: hypothetical protein VKB09_02015, partial [Thermomicrobiales bacterium]|nr:hypothetical protein [Thermomicrobiales bacterium]